MQQSALRPASTLVILKRVPPAYTLWQRLSGVSGTVRLNVVIAEDGHVKGTTFVSGPRELAYAAQEAVEQWRFGPTLIDGRPWQILTTIDLTFGKS